MTDKDEIQNVVDRIASIYSEDLEGFDFYLDEWNNPDTLYRLRISPENATWVSDIGPAFKDLEKVEAFLRGMEEANYLEDYDA